MRDEPDILSPAGDRRRAAILALALTAGRRRRLRRRAGRAAVAVAGMAVIAAVVWPRPAVVRPLPVVIVTPERTDGPRSTTAITPPPPVPPAVTVERIETDPTIADRLALRPGRPRWVMLDDAGLVRELAAAGRPGGVVRINGEVRLLLREGSSGP